MVVRKMLAIVKIYHMPSHTTMINRSVQLITQLLNYGTRQVMH